MTAGETHHYTAIEDNGLFFPFIYKILYGFSARKKLILQDKNHVRQGKNHVRQPQHSGVTRDKAGISLEAVHRTG